MLPLLVPPSALEISEAILEAPTLNQISLIKRSGGKKKLNQLILNSVILLPGVQNPLHQATLLEKLCGPNRQKMISMHGCFCYVFFYVYLWQSVQLENALQAIFLYQTNIIEIHFWELLQTLSIKEHKH